jgi:hypothetical protein
MIRPTKTQTPKPKSRRDEMADFDADMERDEALDLRRDRELVKGWLSPQKGSRQ